MALGRMITGFITVIVGASLVPTLVTVINSAASELRDTTTISTADNNVLLANGTNTTLTAKTTYPLATCQDFSIVNATGGETIIGSGNYTFYSTECKFIFQDASPYAGTQGNVSYGYETNALTGTQGSAASLLELTILFFSLGVMIAGVGTSVSGLVEYGLV